MSLRALLSEGSTYMVSLGIITSIEGDVAEVEIMPDREDITCRVVYPGAVEGRGLYCQPEAEDEVLVLIPSDRTHLAVCLVGLHGRAAPVPAIGPGLTLVHPEGTRIAKTATAARQAAVVAPLPSDVKAAVDDIVQALQGTLAVPVPAVTPSDGGLSLYADTILPLLLQVLLPLVQLQAKLNQPQAYLSASLEVE